MADCTSTHPSSVLSCTSDHQHPCSSVEPRITSEKRACLLGMGPCHTLGITWTLQLLVAKNLAEGLVHFQSAIVANVSLLSEVIHEKIDSGTGRADHVSKNLMIWIGDFRYWRALSIQVG
jgi:hypothetical protein